MTHSQTYLIQAAQIAAAIDHQLMERMVDELVALRERYLGFMRDITEKWLDWKKIGPIVADWQKVIATALKGLH